MVSRTHLRLWLNLAEQREETINKVDIGRALRILDTDLAHGVRPPRVKRALMPGDYPPQVHPDDWEPDDESDRGPVQPA